MSSIKAKRLAIKVATVRKNQKNKVSRKEIKDKINEIKYLSSQRNVPKLSLRKEIIHLEHKLESVFEIEKELVRREKKESIKVGSLKRQISNLKSRLDNTKDEELRQKVSKLTHILGDLLAKSSSERDVKLSKKILADIEGIDKEKHKAESKELQNIKRVEMLIERIKSIKHELEINKKLEKGNPERIEKLNESISVLEQKWETYKQKHSKTFSKIETYKQDKSIKHSILFTPVEEKSINDTLESKNQLSPAEHFGKQKIEVVDVDEDKIDQEVIQELPLPPPPRIKLKKR